MREDWKDIKINDSKLHIAPHSILFVYLHICTQFKHLYIYIYKVAWILFLLLCAFLCGNRGKKTNELLESISSAKIKNFLCKRGIEFVMCTNYGIKMSTCMSNLNLTRGVNNTSLQNQWLILKNSLRLKTKLNSTL